MKFEHTFTVAAPPARVWHAIMDFERVAPCMPGAEVLERTGDDAYKVRVRVKVGPMSMAYRGQAEVTARDEVAKTAALRVQARETRGQGTANATVQIELAADGAGTRATMRTDLKLSGRAAAMGRGVISDVSEALISDFAANLARMLSEGPGDGVGLVPRGKEQPAAPAATSPSPSAPQQIPGVPPSESPPRPPGPPSPISPPPPTQAPPPTSPPPRGPTPPATGAPRTPPPGGRPVPQAEPLDAGRLARAVIGGRLRDPRTLLSAGALVALGSFAVGFTLGRRSRRW